MYWVIQLKLIFRGIFLNINDYRVTICGITVLYKLLKVYEISNYFHLSAKINNTIRNNINNSHNKNF
ncbi:unnamed protein product [Paramecium octaurelia]|uniref:Uncharacterized protein n=1 Tax=Paramecium octaurelia TaxID=43137 RepID=A0A8S1SN32_PAROT|nr:unnamed protein product [Paramecium octaurelia]